MLCEGSAWLSCRESSSSTETRSRATFSKIVVAHGGAFTAVFTQRELSQCSGYTIVATGRSTGTRATRRELIPPACGIEIIP